MRNTAEDITWTGDENCEMLFLVFKTSHIAATFFPLERRDFIFVSLFLIFSKKVKMQKSEKREKNRFRIFLTKFLTGLVTTQVFNSTGAKGKNKTRFRIVGGAQLLSLSLTRAHTLPLSRPITFSLFLPLQKTHVYNFLPRSLSRSLAQTHALLVRTCVRACACVCVCFPSDPISYAHANTHIRSVQLSAKAEQEVRPKMYRSARI